MKSYDEMSTDAELIDGYLSNGDESAAELLYHRYKRDIFTYVRGQVYNHEDAADLTQETFSKAFQALGTLTEPEKVLSWLYGIAGKTVLQWFRDNNRQKRQPLVIESLEELLAEGVHPESLITYQGPPEILERKIRRQKLRAAVTSLSDKQRTVVKARHFDGKSYGDIAREMGTTVGNARVLHNRAIKQLRTELLKDPDFEEYADAAT